MWMNALDKRTNKCMESAHMRRVFFTGRTHGGGRIVTTGLVAFAFLIAAATLAHVAYAQQSPYSPQRSTLQQATPRGPAERREGPTQDRPGRSASTEDRPARAAAPQQRPSLAGGGVSGGGARATARGGDKYFEVIKTHPIDYPQVPDEGKKILKLQAENMEVQNFLGQLSLTTGWTIMITPEVKGQVTAWLSNISVSDALKVLQINGFYYEKEGNILYVSTNDEYFLREYGELVRAELVVEHADLQDIQQVLSTLQSEAGRIISDPRTGKLVVIDTKDNIEYMKQVMESLDVKLEPKAFELKYAQAEDLLDNVEPILSERGSAQFDPRTNQILVTDVHERIKRVEAMVAKLDVETAKETFSIKYAEADDIESMLESILPDASLVTVDERTRQVSVDTVAERLEEVRGFIEKWDKKLDQVSIEAYILTANSGRVRELGINWEYFMEIGDKDVALQRGLVDLNPLSAGYVLASPLAVGQRAVIGDAASDLAAMIDLLATDTDTEILANPRVMVNDGEIATFKNLTQEPYQESGYSYGYYGGGGGGGTSQVVPRGIKFIDVGTTLDVTPRINEDGWVEMEISAEDSTAVQREIESGTGFTTTVPVKTLNSVTTKVLVESGATIVIGGLRVDSASKNVDKIPFFGDIPFLGHLFKSTQRDAEDRELLIFIRPEIIEAPDAAEQEVLSQFRQNMREQVVGAVRKPFDLGGKQKPFIQRHGVDEDGHVLPFMPKYR